MEGEVELWLGNLRIAWEASSLVMEVASSYYLETVIALGADSYQIYTLSVF